MSWLLYRSLMVQSIITLLTLRQSTVSAMSAACWYSPAAISSFISSALTFDDYSLNYTVQEHTDIL